MLAGRPKLILCVDDEKPCLELRKLVLEKQGYKVLIATNAEEAMKIFCSNGIDLVMLDYLLVGHLGTEVAAKMKKVKPQVKIALLTGLAETPAGTETMDAIIYKGDSPTEVMEKIAALLQLPGQKAAS